MKSLIQLFEDKKIRTLFDEERQEWFFSVVDVCAVLTDSVDPRKYWNKLKQRLKVENEPVTNCHQLKMLATDGKMRVTDALDLKGMLRVISLSPQKKQRLLKCGSQKLQPKKSQKNGKQN